MEMTPKQQQIVNQFKHTLETQIREYFDWNAESRLNVIYFKGDGTIYLSANVVAGISNDYAGIYDEYDYFRIEEDGTLQNISFTLFYEKWVMATKIVRCNPLA